MREIQLSPKLIGGSKEQPQYEENEASPVYDTSGPYGDPQIAINVQQGLAKLRQLHATAGQVKQPNNEINDLTYRPQIVTPLLLY